MDRRLTFRIAIGLMVLIAIPLILRHAWYLVLAARDGEWVLGSWFLVILNIVLFSSFLLLLGWRREVDWTTKGAFLAFIVAMFFEMYGLPVSAYLVLGLLGDGIGYTRPEPLLDIPFALLGFDFHLTLQMIVGSFITTLGGTIVFLAWVQLWQAHRQGDGQLATQGLYLVTRHPQYLGFGLIIIGWMIHWPTLVTLVLGPLVLWRFWSLARQEEKDLRERFGSAWVRYQRRVPRWL